MTDPLKFALAVWSRQLAALPRGTPAPYAFFSRKDWESGEWADFPKRLTKKGMAELTLPTGNDIYFAPCLFDKPARRAVNALPSRWLYADLDEVTPDDLALANHPEPTLVWETSPERYQALWLLDRTVKPVQFEAMNRGLTQLTGADAGGWSTTKVLRVPGSTSTKYGKSRAKRFTVQMAAPRGGKFNVQDLSAVLPKPQDHATNGAVSIDMANLPDRKAVLKEWRSQVPIRARKLLSTKTVVRSDDRSARLWELYNLLLQAGMEPEEVLVAVQGTVWNKWAGQRQELKRLEDDVGKAAAKHGDRSERERFNEARSSLHKRRTGAIGHKVEKRRREREANGKVMLDTLSFKEFMQQQFPEPQWLVEGVWSLNAYGIWAGEFKSYKTVTLLDFLVSVASGRPFLERFTVHQPGRVLYLHEEGRQGLIQDRLHRITSKKGLAPKVVTKGRSAGSTLLEAPADLPLDIASFTGFKLTDTDSQQQFVEYLRAFRPRAVVMESWYLVAGEVDENKTSEVGPVLDWLGGVARDHETALIVSHHYNKGSDDSPKRAGLRVSGAGVFSRWWESAVFIERVGEEDAYTARMEAQHRDLKGIGKRELQFEMDTEDENAYEVTFIDEEETTAKVGDPATVEVNLTRKSTYMRFKPKITEALAHCNSQGMPGVPVNRLANLLGLKWPSMREAADVCGFTTKKLEYNDKEIWFVMGKEPRASAGNRRRGGVRQSTAGHNGSASKAQE